MDRNPLIIQSQTNVAFNAAAVHQACLPDWEYANLTDTCNGGSPGGRPFFAIQNGRLALWDRELPGYENQTAVWG